jgi:PEP-CTERM motif.
MRGFGIRRVVKVTSIVVIAGAALAGAAASAATIFNGAIQIRLGDSFPDPETWALMLASFGLIGMGVRSRRRFVVLA